MEVARHRSFLKTLDAGSIPAPEDLRHPPQPSQEPTQWPQIYL